VTGDLAVLPLGRFFQGRSGESMILDPVILDGAGQLIGAWVLERIEDAGCMFPTQIDEVRFYAPRSAAPAVLPCRVWIREVESRRLRADMVVLGGDGRALLEIRGWRDDRFHTPNNRTRICNHPASEFFGRLWDVPTAPLPARGCYVSSLVDGLGEHGSSTLDDACAYLLLGRRERQQWQTLTGPTNRRAQWLLGRAAAKDAARAYLKRRYGLELYPADVEVTADPRGRPLVTGGWAAGLPSLPAISLAHTGLIGVAIAGGDAPEEYLGIDIERIRPREPGFVELAFAPQEREWLAAIEEEARWEWMTRFWCAKEATAKAVGRGLEDGPRGLRIQHVDWAEGRLALTLTGALADAVPDLRDQPVIAHTMRTGDLVVASTVCERAGETL
jgi:phosphopantetheinyl transferase